CWGPCVCRWRCSRRVRAHRQQGCPVSPRPARNNRSRVRPTTTQSSGRQRWVAQPLRQIVPAPTVTLEWAGGAVPVLDVTFVFEAAGATDRPGTARALRGEGEEPGALAGDGTRGQALVPQQSGAFPGGFGVPAQETGRMEHVEVHGVEHPSPPSALTGA